MPFTATHASVSGRHAIRQTVPIPNANLCGLRSHRLESSDRRRFAGETDLLLLIGIPMPYWDSRQE